MLKPSNDSKTRARKTQQNTFGLLPGPEGSCPGATTGQGGCWCALANRKLHTCYVDKLQNARPNVRAVLQHNTELLKAAGDDVDEMTRLLEQEFSRFASTEKSNTRPYYRLHWSGDVFSTNYALALTRAISKYPDIVFWTYTRSWDLIPNAMLKLPNLFLFLSLDPCNVRDGLKWLVSKRKHHQLHSGRIRIAYMGNEIPKSLQQHALQRKTKFMQCPVDAGKMELEEACQNKCGFCMRLDPRILIFNT